MNNMTKANAKCPDTKPIQPVIHATKHHLDNKRLRLIIFGSPTRTDSWLIHRANEIITINPATPIGLNVTNKDFGRNEGVDHASELKLRIVPGMSA